MNYIAQINGFWIAQEVNQLGCSEIALYFYLLEVCNKSGWTGTIYRNNYKVMADLSIRSPKTLQSIRDRLRSANLINYRTKNGDANVEYTIFDLGNFYRGKVAGSGVGTGVGERLGSGVDNINKTKTKQNIKDIADKPPPTKSFIKPVLDEVEEHFKNKNFEKNLGWPAEKITEKAEQFINYYESKGWMIGKAKMKDWRAAINGQWLKTKSWENETTTNRTGNSKSEGANNLIEKLRNNLTQRGQGDNTG